MKKPANSISNFYFNFSKKLLEIFFPEECLSCKKIGETVCLDCLKEIENHKNKNNVNLDWVYFCFNYENQVLKNSLFSLKYHHNKTVAKYLAKISSEKFLKFLKEKSGDCLKELLILPIPISKKRLKERDYNQSEILILAILKNILEENDLNLRENLKTDLLIKEKHTIKFAHSHDSAERQSLIKNAFKINEKYDSEYLKDKKIILIDDITTSGSTFYEARNTLISQGVSKENVFGFAIAH